MKKKIIFWVVVVVLLVGIVLYVHYVRPISVLVNVLVLGVGAVLGWVSHILYGKYFSKK